MDNKTLVERFYEDVFNNGRLEKVEEYVAVDYIQHNPHVATGRDGFTAFIRKFLERGPQVEIVDMAADGDRVYAFFKCTFSDGSVNKVCDIYRIEHAMLTEHWDIVERNVETTESVNDNGLF